jgi:uncharacterized membrane protein YedE/YeeE
VEPVGVAAGFVFVVGRCFAFVVFFAVAVFAAGCFFGVLARVVWAEDAIPKQTSIHPHNINLFMVSALGSP